MAVDVFKLFGSIGLKTEEAEKGLRDIVGEAETTGNKLTSTFKKAAVAIGTVFAVDKIIDFGKLAANAASEAEEFAGAFEQVFKGFEEEAERSMQNVTDTIKASEGRFRESFLQISGFGKASGMETAEAIDLSNRAVIAAADYAAMYGGSLENTTESLQSFLKGNFANDAALGVSATEFTRNAKAVELYGDEFINLTETQKQWTLLAMVEEANEQSGAMGQAAREADSYANTIGELKNAWNEFLIIVGGPIIKAVVPIIQGITKAIGTLTEMTVPLTDAFSGWIDGIMGVSDASETLNESIEKVAMSAEDLETLATTWNDLTLEEKQAQVETMGKDDLEGLMNLLGVDFENIPDEYTKEAFVNTHGKDALEELLWVTGEWHNLTLEEKRAVLEAQLDNDELAEAIEMMNMWDDAEFYSKYADINMNSADAEQQVLDLINDYRELQGLEPIDIEVTAETSEANEALEETQSILSTLWDVISGKESIASGLTKVRTAFDRLTTLLRTKVSSQLEKVQGWFNDIVEVLQEIDFEQLIENILEFSETAIEVFTDLIENITEFLEPLVDGWERSIDNIIGLFGNLVRAFNQAMSGDWSGAFNTLKEAIGEFLISQGENILEAWGGIWENVKDLTTSIDWAGVAQTVMTFLGNALSSAVEFIGDIGGVIKSWIQDKLELDDGSSWGDIGRAILGLITTGISTAITGISNVASSIITWIFDALESTGDTDWLEVGKSILTGIFNTFSSLAQSFTEIVVALIKGIDDMMTAEQFHTLVETILNSIVTAIGAITGGLLTVAVALVNGIALGLLGADNWGEVADNITTKVKDVLASNPFEFNWLEWLNLDPSKWDWSNTGWYKLKELIKEAMGGSLPNIENPNEDGSGSGTTATGMNSMIINNKPSQLIELGETPDKPITFVDQYDTMATEATTGMNKVNQAIRAGYEAIRTTFTQMESNMIRLMTQIMTKLQEPVQSGMLTINQEFRQGYEPIRTTFTQMGNNLERLMTQAIKKVETSVKTNMASVASAFRSKISEVERAGADTGRGFYNGLNGQKTRIINLANDIASSVLTTMEDALDINSPSGETAWIADMTIQGLYNNLKAGISRIKEVTGEVSSAMLFDPQTADLGFAYGQAQTSKPSMTEVMLDEVTQLLKQLRDKDDALYMDGYELGRRGTKYINQENEIRATRNSRLKGGTA